ncbi:MAG: TrbC/VirB2 family protein [Patescibacteria group bacterium]|jgi:hypothetical protein
MKNLSKIFTPVATFCTALLAYPVMAQTLPIIEPLPSGDETTIITAIRTIIDWLFILAGALAVAYLVYAGIQYITGGAKGAEAAKTSIINAIIGIAVIVLSYVIVGAVVNLF